MGPEPELDEDQREVLRTIIELHEQGQPVDAESVKVRLRRIDITEDQVFAMIKEFKAADLVTAVDMKVVEIADEAEAIAEDES